jgi:exodeoxyribonuclease-5
MIDEKYKLFEGVYANEEQITAINKMTEFLQDDDPNNDSFVLIGRGGTGKTTIVEKVRYVLKGKVMILAAPSHAAKKVLEKRFSYNIDAFTIASLLGMKLNTRTGKFEIDEYKRREQGIPIETADVVLIDECSMIDEYLFSQIMKYKSRTAKIIFLGDNAQLPPIREESSLFQDKDSPVFDLRNRCELKERVRQSKQSPIVPLTDVFANNIEKGNRGDRIEKNPLHTASRVTDYNRETEEGVIFTNSYRQAIYNLALDFLKPESESNPMFAKGIVYTNAVREDINNQVRSIVWKDKAKHQFVIGEQVIAFDTFTAITGQPLIHNSDNFYVKKITKSVHQKGYKLLLLTVKNEHFEVTVPVMDRESARDFQIDVQDLFKRKKMREAYRLKDSVANIQYGYAITSHKSQGSTFTNVFVFEDDIMDVFKATDKTKNQSMYVATSRPTKKLVMYSKLNYYQVPK